MARLTNIPVKNGRILRYIELPECQQTIVKNSPASLPPSHTPKLIPLKHRIFTPNKEIFGVFSLKGTIEDCPHPLLFLKINWDRG